MRSHLSEKKRRNKLDLGLVFRFSLHVKQILSYISFVTTRQLEEGIKLQILFGWAKVNGWLCGRCYEAQLFEWLQFSKLTSVDILHCQTNNIMI